MKFLRIYVPVMLLLSLASCRKFVDNQKEKAAMSFITEGRWKVESYLVDSTPVTSEFEGYKFKFNDDGTVNGQLGEQTQNGTWSGDPSDFSITSEFPGAGDPLRKLNGKWIVKDSGLTFVKASLATPGATMHLHLIKIP